MAADRLHRDYIDALLDGDGAVSNGARRSIEDALNQVPQRALAMAVGAHTRIRVLGSEQRYAQASPELARLGIDVDAWPAPPAGLFVVAERTVYLRGLSRMTVGHEFGHAVDCALGSGVYRSGLDAQLRAALAGDASFVTPYAATGLDEWFAEGFRSICSLNDPLSPWPRVSPERLKRCSPVLHDYLARAFDLELAPAVTAPAREVAAAGVSPFPAGVMCEQPHVRPLGPASHAQPAKRPRLRL